MFIAAIVSSIGAVRRHLRHGIRRDLADNNYSYYNTGTWGQATSPPQLSWRVPAPSEGRSLSVGGACQMSAQQTSLVSSWYHHGGAHYWDRVGASWPFQGHWLPRVENINRNFVNGFYDPLIYFCLRRKYIGRYLTNNVYRCSKHITDIEKYRLYKYIAKQ